MTIPDKVYVSGSIDFLLNVGGTTTRVKPDAGAQAIFTPALTRITTVVDDEVSDVGQVVVDIDDQGRLNGGSNVELIDLSSDDLLIRIRPGQSTWEVSFVNVKVDGQRRHLASMHIVPTAEGTNGSGVNQLARLLTMKTAGQVVAAGAPGPPSTVPGPPGAPGGSDEETALRVASGAQTGPAVDQRAGALVKERAYTDQVDHVDLVRSNAPRYVNAQLVRTATDKWQIRYHDGLSRGAIYGFIKDGNDDYIKLDGCYIGYGDSVVSFAAADPADLAGTWNTSTFSYYTTAVNATYTETLPAAGGSKITTQVMTENRGGLWFVDVYDGGIGGTKVLSDVPISCWADSATPTAVRKTVATGWDPTKIPTLVHKFQGADPAHAPTGGTARGYIRRDTVAGTVVSSNPGAAPTYLALADGSNKEFAFSVSKNGNTNWFPEHNTVGSCFNIDPPTFIVDGVAVAALSMSVGQSIPFVRDVRFRQHFYGQIVNQGNVAELTTNHVFDFAGELRFSGRMKALTSFSITGYCMMLPAFNTASRFVSGLLNSKTSDGGDTYTYFTAEDDAVFSGAVINVNQPNAIAAGTLRNARLTYRRGRGGRGAVGERLFVWQRPTKPKMYWKPFDGHTFAAGDGYAWSFNAMVADIDGVYALANPAA